MQNSFQDSRLQLDTFFVFEIPMPSEYDVLRAIDLYNDLKIWWQPKGTSFNFNASVSEKSKKILVLSNEEGETDLEFLVGVILEIAKERKIGGRKVLRYGEFSTDGVADGDGGGYIIFDFDRKEAKHVNLNRVLALDLENKSFTSRKLHQIFRHKRDPFGQVSDGILNVIFCCLHMRSFGKK